MHSSSPNPAAKKANKGRQKIEIKKVEQKNKLLVTFSKRKSGLFRKAAEISLLCNSDVAVVVFSQTGKIYTSGYPDPDSVLRRYLSGAPSSSSSSPDLPSAVTNLRLQYEAAMKELQEEKMKKKKEEEEKSMDEISEMGLEDVEKFKERIQEMRRKAVAAMEKKKVVKAARTLTATEILYMCLLNGDIVGNASHSIFL